MTDATKAAALATELEEYAFLAVCGVSMLPTGRLQAAAATLRALASRMAAEDASRELYRDLLRRTAVALKGPEFDLTTHGWMDLPEIAAALRAGREAP